MPTVVCARLVQLFRIGNGIMGWAVNRLLAAETNPVIILRLTISSTPNPACTRASTAHAARLASMLLG